MQYDQLRYMTTRPLKYLGTEYPAGTLLPDGGDIYVMRTLENVGSIQKVMPKHAAPARKVRDAVVEREIVGFTTDKQPIYAGEEA
jgi:hypothetical protein